MAYHDENGKITIDEQAANKDIKRLTEAAQVLKTSRDAIKSLQRQATDMQGETSTAIMIKSQEMEKKLTQMIDKLESTADFIRKTVRRYEILDEQIKQAIQSAANVASAVTATAGVAVNAATNTAIKVTSEIVTPSSSPKVSNTGSSGRGSVGSSGSGKNSSTKSDIGSILKGFGDKVEDFFDDIF